MYRNRNGKDDEDDYGEYASEQDSLHRERGEAHRREDPEKRDNARHH